MPITCLGELTTEPLPPFLREILVWSIPKPVSSVRGVIAERLVFYSSPPFCSRVFDRFGRSAYGQCIDTLAGKGDSYIWVEVLGRWPFDALTSL
jgi:hypothetical protein